MSTGGISHMSGMHTRDTSPISTAHTRSHMCLRVATGEFYTHFSFFPCLSVSASLSPSLSLSASLSQCLSFLLPEMPHPLQHHNARNTRQATRMCLLHHFENGNRICFSRVESFYFSVPHEKICNLKIGIGSDASIHREHDAANGHRADAVAQCHWCSPRYGDGSRGTGGQGWAHHARRRAVRGRRHQVSDCFFPRTYNSVVWAVRPGRRLTVWLLHPGSIVGLNGQQVRTLILGTPGMPSRIFFVL